MLFGDKMLADQGSTTRILAVMPESAAGTRFSRKSNPQSFSNIRKFSARLRQILELDLPLAKGATNQLKPRALKLCPKASKLWFSFADKIEAQLGPGGSLDPVRGLANKAPEHAGRIAAALTLFENINANEVSPATLESAIQIVTYYLAERIRIHLASQIDADLLLAQKLLRWLHEEWIKKEPSGLVSLPNIYQRGPNSIRDQDTARRIVEILEHHGWVAKIEGGAEVGKIWRREVWQLWAKQ